MWVTHPPNFVEFRVISENHFSEGKWSGKFGRRFFDTFFDDNSGMEPLTSLGTISKIFSCDSASNGVQFDRKNRIFKKLKMQNWSFSGHFGVFHDFEARRALSSLFTGLQALPEA